jgi:hypothetical protein
MLVQGRGRNSDPDKANSLPAFYRHAGEKSRHTMKCLGLNSRPQTYNIFIQRVHTILKNIIPFILPVENSLNLRLLILANFNIS